MALKKFTLRRTSYTDSGIFGTLFREDGSLCCFTLEHAYVALAPEESYFAKIPAGVYRCRRRMSPKFKYEVFHVLDVPNATFVEIHRGNFQSDSEGCILLGSGIVGTMITRTMITRTMITRSEMAFGKFMAELAGDEEFELTVRPRESQNA